MKRGRSLEDVVAAALLEDTDEVPYTQVRSRNKKPRGAKGAKGKSSAIPPKLTNAIGSENDGNAKDPHSLPTDPLSQVNELPVVGELSNCAIQSLQESMMCIMDNLSHQISVLMQKVQHICQYLGLDNETCGSNQSKPAERVSVGVHVTNSKSSQSIASIKNPGPSSNRNELSCQAQLNKQPVSTCVSSISDLINVTLSRIHSESERRAKSVIITGMPEREDDDIPPVLDLLKCEFNFVPSQFIANV